MFLVIVFQQNITILSSALAFWKSGVGCMRLNEFLTLRQNDLFALRLNAYRYVPARLPHCPCCFSVRFPHYASVFLTLCRHAPGRFLLCAFVFIAMCLCVSHTVFVRFLHYIWALLTLRLCISDTASAFLALRPCVSCHVPACVLLPASMKRHAANKLEFGLSLGESLCHTYMPTDMF